MTEFVLLEGVGLERHSIKSAYVYNEWCLDRAALYARSSGLVMAVNNAPLFVAPVPASRRGRPFNICVCCRLLSSNACHPGRIELFNICLAMQPPVYQGGPS